MSELVAYHADGVVEFVGCDPFGPPAPAPAAPKASPGPMKFGEYDLSDFDNGAALGRRAQPAPPTAPIAAAPSVVTKPKAGEDAKALIKRLRARLREVEREIKARENFELERDQIKRLLAAAKPAPATVRQLRAAK